MHGDPVAIILAAGESQRFGRNKLLEPIGDMAMIERVVDAHRRARKVHDVVLVHGPGHEEDYSWLRGTHLHMVENPDPAEGMVSSIRAGLRSTWLHERDFLVHPADVPFVSAEIIDRVVSTFLGRECSIVLPSFQGLGGHPGMFAAGLASDFFLHGDNQGAREILLRYQAKTVRLRVHDPDVCFDVDTPDDLAIADDAGARWARVEQKIENKRKGLPH